MAWRARSAGVGIKAGNAVVDAGLTGVSSSEVVSLGASRTVGGRSTAGRAFWVTDQAAGRGEEEAKSTAITERVAARAGQAGGQAGEALHSREVVARSAGLAVGRVEAGEAGLRTGQTGAASVESKAVAADHAGRSLAVNTLRVQGRAGGAAGVGRVEEVGVHGALLAGGGVAAPNAAVHGREAVEAGPSVEVVLDRTMQAG